MSDSYFGLASAEKKMSPCGRHFERLDSMEATSGQGRQVANEGKTPLKEWIRQCRQGNRGAFDEIMREYHRPVYQMCWYLTGSETDADDAVQETFLRVFRAIGRFRNPAKFRTWLFRICANVCHDFQRRSKPHARLVSITDPGVEREVALKTSSPAASPRAAASREETCHHVREAIRQLPESHRRVVVLVALEELSHKEAARALRLRTATVTWYMGESRKRLRPLLARKLDLEVQGREEQARRHA